MPNGRQLPRTSARPPAEGRQAGGGTRRGALEGALAVATTLLPACEPLATARGPGVQQQPQWRTGITLSITRTGGADHFERWQENFRRFERQYAGIKVDGVWGGADGAAYLAKLTSQLVAGSPPDVFVLFPDQFDALEAQGQLLDLTPHVTRARYDLSDYLPGEVDLWSKRQRRFGLPVEWNVFPLYLNQDLLDQAGVPYPPTDWTAPGWTWQDLLEAARRLTVRDAAGTTAQYAVLLGSWMPWVWSHGGDILNRDSTRCVLDSAEAVEGLQLFQDFTHRYGVAPNAEGSRAIGGAAGLNTGRVAIRTVGAAPIPNFRRDLTFRWDVAVLPRARAGRFTNWTGTAWFAPKATRHADEAALLAMFLSTRESLGAAFGAELLARKSLAYSKPFIDPDQPPKHARVFPDAAPAVRMWPRLPNWPDISRVINAEMAPFREGQRTTREAGAAIVRAVNPLLPKQ